MASGAEFFSPDEDLEGGDDFEGDEAPEEYVQPVPGAGADAGESDDDDQPAPPAPAAAPPAASAGATWTWKGQHSFQKQPFTETEPLQWLRHTARTAATQGSEVDIFLLFLPPAHIDEIVSRTNNYVEQIKAAEERPPWVPDNKPWPPRWTRNWKPLTRHEFYVFMGMLVLMGAYRLPDMRSWWRDQFPVPGAFRNIMPRDRFVALKAALHFAPERVKPDGADALYKVNDLIEPFFNRCRSILQLGKVVSADEACVRVESKMSPQSVNYSKLPKPIGQGILFDMLCDAGRAHGYVSDAVVRRKGQRQADRWLLLAGRAVGKWRVWYFDRLSTSEALFVKLLKDHDTYATGTLKNQKKATQLGGLEKRKQANRGDWTWSVLSLRDLRTGTGRNNDYMFAALWHDVKDNLLFLSTAEAPVPGTVMRRVAGETEKQPIAAPTACNHPTTRSHNAAAYATPALTPHCTSARRVVQPVYGRRRQV